MFFNEYHFRDALVFGSALMIAAVTLPGGRAMADEIYLCGDGRTLLVTDESRSRMLQEDPCVKSWAFGPKTARAAAAIVHKGQANAVESRVVETAFVVNAEEVPVGEPIRQPRAAKAPTHRQAMSAAGRPSRSNRKQRHGDLAGLTYMGGGIYAQ
jgi:hypothetical protein